MKSFNLLLLQIFTIILTQAYPSNLDDPQDCYVPVPDTNCIRSNCRNQGGNTDCMHAMGQCLIYENGGEITVDGTTVSNDGEVTTSFGSGQLSVDFTIPGSIKHFFVVASSGVTVASASSIAGNTKCSGSLRWFQNSSGRSFRLTVSPTAEEVEFEYIRGSGYGQIHGTKVTIKNADLLVPDTSPEPTKEPSLSPTLSPTTAMTADPCAKECLAPVCSCESCITIAETCSTCAQLVCRYSDVSADYVFVGAGPGGSFAASELSKYTDDSILLLEWGVTDEEDDWYGVPAGDTTMWAPLESMWSEAKKNQFMIDGQIVQATITGGCQLHNAMVFSQMPWSDVDKLGLDWSESFYNDLWSTIKQDLTMTWSPVPESQLQQLSGFDVVTDPSNTVGIIAGKVTGMNYQNTCKRGTCKFGTAWEQAPQREFLNDFRLERETWYKQLVKSNSKIDVIAFRQETKVEKLVLENGMATGVQLTNGTIIRVGKSVVLAGGNFGTPEILLRTTELSNEYAGKNFHHHSLFAGAFASASADECADKWPDWLSYVSTTGMGFFRFRVFCNGQVDWFYGTANTGARGRVYIDSDGDFKVEQPARIHEDDVPHIAADIVEFTTALENSGLTSPHTTWGDLTNPATARSYLMTPDLWTDFWHYGGTCSAGTCADNRMKVRGTTNVYVADASASPKTFNGHATGVATFYGAAAARFVVEDNLGLDFNAFKVPSMKPTEVPTMEPTEVPTMDPTDPLGDGCAVNLVGENWRCTGTVQKFNRETLQLCADEAWTLNAPFFTFRENKRKCEVPTDDPALQCGDDANQGANTWSTFSIDCPPPTFGPTMEPTEPAQPKPKVTFTLKLAGAVESTWDQVKEATKKAIASTFGVLNEKVTLVLRTSRRRLQEESNVDVEIETESNDDATALANTVANTPTATLTSAMDDEFASAGVTGVTVTEMSEPSAVVVEDDAMKCSPNMENPLGLVCNMGTGINGDNVEDGVWDSPCGGIENRMYCPIQDTTTPIMCNNGNCESTAADCFANGGVKYGDVPCGTYPWDVVKIQKIFDNTGNSRENRFKGIGRRVRKVLRNNQLEDGSPVFAKWIWRRMRDIVKNDGFSKQNFNRLNKKFENLKDFFVAMN